jgi:hypothetical protein
MKFISSQDEAAIEAHLTRDSAPENEVLYSCGGLYMHGKLQDEIGYDIPILTEGEIKPGVFDCDVQFPDGNVISARAYIWETRFQVNPWNVRGLIVHHHDIPSRAYAIECLLENAENL